jgi:hypothetical protein
MDRRSLGWQSEAMHGIIPVRAAIAGLETKSMQLLIPLACQGRQ